MALSTREEALRMAGVIERALEMEYEVATLTGITSPVATVTSPGNIEPHDMERLIIVLRALAGARGNMVGLENQHLKMTIAGMQGHTFYIEDDEGVLRRWTPPRPNTMFEKQQKED